ncbi:MAG: ABC transporter permease [Planctomycetes bacterium]|nr:ABC transporter permease [Planctomycetota bacterium]
MNLKSLWPSLLSRVLPPVLAVACAVVLGMLIVLALRLNPFAVASEVFTTASMPPVGLRDDVGYVLAYATPLIFSGLAVAVAFRAGLFNIGGMGQIMIGSLCCGLVGWKLAALPMLLLIPAAIAVAAAGGALWGAIAGALKAWRGSHEVIITIMLNFVAVALTDWLANGPWKDPHGMAAQLPAIAPHARLARLGTYPVAAEGTPPSLGLPIPGYVPVNLALPIALLLAAAVWVWLWRTTAGYEHRAVGHNPEASRAAGISVKRVTLRAMALSGALAGISASDLVLGYKHTFRQDDAMGYAGQAFVGIAVSLMGQNHPVGIVFAALLFGALQHTGVLLKTIPKDLILILQAAVILFVICGNEIFRRLLARRVRPA